MLQIVDIYIYVCILISLVYNVLDKEMKDAYVKIGQSEIGIKI